MRRAAPESAAAPVSHYAAGPVELDDVCRTKLKLPYQTDSDAALLLNLIHQLGSAHEWSGVWIRPQFGTAVLIWCGKHRLVRQGLPHYATLERQLIQTPLFSCVEPNA